MKNCLTSLLIIFLITTSLSGFIDKEEEKIENLYTKLNELKAIRGVLLTGKGMVFFNANYGKGEPLEPTGKTKDYQQFMQMDINFLAKPLPALECGARLRFKNDLSGFWGKGDSFSTEDLYGKLLLFKFIKLRFGTIYGKLSPFTLYAPINIVPLRSELFYTYFQEDLYENLLDQPERFPLKGISLNAAVIFEGNTELGLKGIVSKLDKYSSAGNTFDRYMFGANSDLIAFDMTEISVNYVSIQDIKGTENTKEEPFNSPLKSDVYSAELELNCAPFLFGKNQNIKGFGGEGEIAYSTFNSNTTESTNTESKGEECHGLAWRWNLFLNYNDNIKLNGGLRYIEYEFVSPGAQTRIVTPARYGSYFDHGFNDLGTDALKPSLFDYSYRNKIMIARDNLDKLNYIYSMNIATPNRTGLFCDLNLSFGLVRAAIEVSSMKEVRPIAAPNKNKREFFRNENEISFDLSKILEYLPILSGFFTMENNKRDDWPATKATSETNLNEKEDYKINIYGAEAVFELFQNFKLIGMYQLYSVKGLKTIDGYKSNHPIEIKGYHTTKFDIKNSVIGIGFIYEITRAIKVQADYFYKKYEEKEDNMNYNLNNGRMLFGISF